MKSISRSGPLKYPPENVLFLAVLQFIFRLKTLKDLKGNSGGFYA